MSTETMDYLDVLQACTVGRNLLWVVARRVVAAAAAGPDRDAVLDAVLSLRHALLRLHDAVDTGAAWAMGGPANADARAICVAGADAIEVTLVWLRGMADGEFDELGNVIDYGLVRLEEFLCALGRGLGGGRMA